MERSDSHMLHCHNSSSPLSSARQIWQSNTHTLVPTPFTTTTQYKSCNSFKRSQVLLTVTQTEASWALTLSIACKTTTRLGGFKSACMRINPSGARLQQQHVGQCVPQGELREMSCDAAAVTTKDDAAVWRQQVGTCLGYAACMLLPSNTCLHRLDVDAQPGKVQAPRHVCARVCTTLCVTPEHGWKHGIPSVAVLEMLWLLLCLTRYKHSGLNRSIECAR